MAGEPSYDAAMVWIGRGGVQSHEEGQRRARMEEGFEAGYRAAENAARGQAAALQAVVREQLVSLSNDGESKWCSYCGRNWPVEQTEDHHWGCVLAPLGAALSAQPQDGEAGG